MTDDIKSGHELLEEFFASLEGIEGVDADTAKVVKGLYKEGKLTTTNIANEMSALREAKHASEADKD